MYVRRTGCGEICSDVPFSSVCGTRRIGPGIPVWECDHIACPGLWPLRRSSERRLVQDRMTCVIQRETRPRFIRLSIAPILQIDPVRKVSVSDVRARPRRSWPARARARGARWRPPPTAATSCCPARPSASRHSRVRSRMRRTPRRSRLPAPSSVKIRMSVASRRPASDPADSRARTAGSTSLR